MANHYKHPPVFSGKATDNSVSVKEFAQKFKIYANLHNIHANAAQCKTHLGQFLSDMAFKWYERQADVDFDDLDALMRELINAFDRPPAKLHIRQKLQARKYLITDSVESYTDSILELCNKLDITDQADQVSYLLLGLPPVIQANLNVLNLETFAAACRALTNLKPLITQELGNQTSTSVPQLAAMQSQLEKLESKLDNSLSGYNHKLSDSEPPAVAALRSQFQTLTNKLDNLTPYTTSHHAIMQNNVVCQLCNKPGHEASICRSLQQWAKPPPPQNGDFLFHQQQTRTLTAT